VVVNNIVIYHTASSVYGTEYRRDTIKVLDQYNKVIRDEYTVSLTNLEPEYHQKNKQSVPNPCK